MKKRITAILSAFIMTLGAAANLVPITVSAADAATVIRLDPANASPFNDGKFQGWGTALCWWANRVGYSTELTQQAADLFFSDEGLSLDIARYNLGGGDDPSHNHINRSDSKVPGVYSDYKLSADGKDVESITYDITKDQNQLNIAKAALAANPDLYFEGFSNSAPYFMTVSGCTGGGDPASSDNLKADMYDDFAKFIAAATNLFKQEGIVFQSYSPMNEPDTDYWGVNSPKQEGCHFGPGTSQSNMIVETRKALDDAGLTDVLVAGMDETSLKKTANNLGSLTTEAKAALGRVDTHTYSDRNYHAQVKAKALELGKNLWQSEVDGKGDGFALASMIIEDMNGMQPSAWVMWDIIDRHKDSNFIAPDGSKPEANSSLNDISGLWGVGMADHDAERIELANNYYAYGQFTKYIEPGMTIIGSSSNTLAAYDRETGKIVIVALNNDSSDKNVTFDLRDFSKTGSTAKVIRTNASSEKWAKKEDITVTNKQFDATLGAKTITTYVIEGDNTPVHYMTISGSNTIVAGVDYTYQIGGSDFEFIEGSINWSVSDPDMAEVTTDRVSNTATVKAKKGGSFTLTMAAGSISTAIDIKALDVQQTITFINKKSGKGLETKGKGITSNTQLVQWENRNLDTAAWKLAATTDGHFNIINCNADMLLAANEAAKPVISANIAATSDAAKWDLIDHGGYFEIKNVQTEKSLNVSGQSTANGGDVILYTFGGGDNELWSIGTAADNLEHVEPVVIDYSEKYKGTDYTFIGNVDSATNDFSESLKGFEVKNFASLGSDSSGEAALLVQNSLSNTGNTQRSGYATLTLDKPITGATGYVINLSFDMFTPHSDGTSSFELTTPNGENIAAIKVTSYAGKYSLQIGEELVCEDENAAAYFKNNLSDRVKDSNISDGGHVEVYYTPLSGDVTVTIKAISNNSALKTYNGKAASGGIGKVYFAGEYTAWNKVMVVDNLITNIISTNKKAAFVTESAEGKTATMAYSIDGVADKAVIIGALYDKTTNALRELKVREVTDTIGKVTLEFENNIEDYDFKPMIWYSLSSVIPIEISGDTPPEPPEPTPTPEPTAAPVLPDSGELISLNFDNGDLTSTSTYGKAAAVGTAKFATVDGKKCVQFDNTSSTVLKLTDANGNPLLTGQEHISISFKVKPTSTGTSWWFYAAPNDSAQTFNQEKYLGALTKSDTIEVERYNNSGSRSAAATTALQANEWNDVLISFGDNITAVYVNGVLASAASTVNISDMLGKNSVCYIGKANWGSGEYATGYIDDFVIYNHAIENPLGSIDLGDLSAITEDITTIPSIDGVTWETSDETVITADGTVTRADETKTATLTAKTTSDGIEFKKSFTVTVPGYTAVLDTFAAYVEGNSIKYTSDYTAAEKYNMTVILETELGPEEPLIKQDNQASGELTGLVPNCSYYVTCELIDKESGNVVKKISKTFTIKDTDDMEAYLFVHFVDTQETAEKEQIYFSVSQDGQTWTTLNDKKPVLTSNVGEKGVRDPYILRGEDGKFFIIATDLSIYNTRNNGKADWGRAAQRGSKSIVVWESDDLVNWSEASLVKINDDSAGCTWAPEACYDPERDEYMVFWASVISKDEYAKFRIYRSYTSDFKTFTAPELYIEEPNAVIDTTIIDHKGVYYRFTKNEARSSITMQKCTTLNGNWKDVETYTLGDMTGYEGPTIYKINGEDKWCLLLDYFSKSQGYKPFVTSDITKGNFTAGTAFNFDGTYRHGTVMPITTEEYNALIAKYTSAE